MQEFITIQKKPIMWEALPTIVLKNYRDSEEINPYTQCRICAVSNDLYIRLFSFETSPSEESEISIYLSKDGVVAEFTQRKTSLFARVKKADGEVLEIPDLKFTEIGGENNQGIFWGGEFAVKADVLKDVFGVSKLNKGIVFKGEVVKKKYGEDPHLGTLFAKEEKDFFEMMDFEGEFVVVEY